jgi:hypothetical protein
MNFSAIFRAFLWPNFRDLIPASDFGGGFAALCLFAARLPMSSLLEPT